MSELSDVIRAVNEHFFAPDSIKPPDSTGALLDVFKRIADTSEDQAARIEALGALGCIIGMFDSEAEPVVMH